MKTLAIILAGGKGTRLEPLVKERCKPAVPFGGKYRIIDFVLSNCLNSGIRQINVMVQYLSDSIQKHIRDGWEILSTALEEYIDVYPPQQKKGEHWYSGTADAIFQNINIIERVIPDYILILGGDHIYRMDYREMIQFHIDKKAVLTIGTIPVPVDEARGQFGILEVDSQNYVKGFEEKPLEPKTIPGKDDICLASMGIYVFSKDILLNQLIKDAESSSSHDFGKDIIPRMISTYPVVAFPFVNADGSPAYWRDVGTLNAYFQANMDLLSETPEFNMFDESWRYRTFQEHSSPTMLLGNGVLINSVVSNSAIIEGTVKNSVLSSNIIVEKSAQIENSIIFSDVVIGKGAKIKNTIIDKKVNIPEGCEIGYKSEIDQKNFTVTDKGIVIIPKKYEFK